jgi:adenosylhomocysteine nucleosidase
MSQTDTWIAILAPMRSELKPLVRFLSLKPTETSDQNLLCCQFGQAKIVASTTGIGTQAARRKAETILDSRPIDHLVVVGIAGGVGSSVDIGDLVVPELVIDLPTRVEYRPSLLGSTELKGKLVTSDDVPIDLTEITHLESQGVIAVDMETAAIASVCERRRCPWSVFRAISDRADDGSTDAAIFNLAGPEGEADLIAVLRFLFTKPERIPHLIRLARGSSLAANVAASAVINALWESYAQ